jgi:adenylate cyclase
MFTDMVGFTDAAQTDEAGALKLLREQEKLVRPLFKTHEGREVKSTGDGFLVEFDSALRAVQCAIDIHQHLQERNSRPGSTPIRLRIGVHLGDVEARGSDIFGDSVNFAARIEPLAEPGGICFSEPVFGQVRNKIPNRLEKLEPKVLKNVRFPMEIYRVVLPWALDLSEVGDPVPPRLAVLPLTNISPDPQDDYFAEGLTEELISVLSQIRGLRVIARTSVSQYKGTTKSIAQIGSELGVSSILEGSVRKAGNQVRISIQLIDARTQEHLWAKAYDRTIENVFAIQADIAEQTAGAFKVEFLGSEREAIQERPTPNPAAYESYLRGIQAFQQSTGFGGEEIDKKAVKYFEDAIREDPQFSGAYSYLANHLIAVMGNTRPGREVFPRARELVAKALELNPNSSDAHTAQGNLAMQMDHDWTRAEMEFREAISLNPSGSTSHFWYGYLLGVLQRFDEAKEQYLKAIELDPLWLLPRLNLAGTYVSSGEVASAIALYEKLEASYPESPMIHMTRAGILALAGQVDDAIRAVELLKDLPDPMSRMIRAGVLAFAGMPEEARELLSEWKEKGQPMYLPAMGAATLYALSGDKETALDLLENDYRDGDRTLWTSYHSQAFDEIRGDPRFVAMIQAMHLPTKTPPHQPKILKRTSG